MSTDQSVQSSVLTKTVAKEPLAFFNEIYDAYENAENAVGGSVDCFYRIGGYVIRLRFAGSALVPYLTPALAHLAIEPVPEPALTICLWDSQSTNTKMPPPPWQGQHHLKRGEIYGFNDERIHTTFQWGVSALSLLDRDRNLGVYWVNTSEQIPYWETGSPLRIIFHVWMRQRGIQMVHAGAVGLPSGGVLLVGRGGSGKSTTALCCLNSELFYASDDYTLLASEPSPTALSIYNTGKKKSDDVERLPFLKSVISNSDRLDTEKALYFLYEHFPEKIISSFPLKALLIPRITGKTDTSLTPTSSTVGLAALVPSTIAQLPGAGKEACQMMMRIVKQIPCYSLNLGTDIGQIPDVILKLLSQG
ncbi:MULTISPECIES: serine kinase [unclassified Coleofasciculus]|uniref:serine kinase n=1 Tax=unclassified Coleofasciculus TaxID=2692782 RepID=UPI00187E92F8|nr:MULTISPECIES: serine kinase [unclassified Coleofasciculus]MBE9125522.1 serine kinase [Coleofasciculus sp. LEGE 07081]MBE9148614.1 serine kinase [Coleofasciculus sp. LEGE 07092]